MTEVAVFVDPFEQYRDRLAKRVARESEEGQEKKRERERKLREKDEKMTWFGPAIGEAKGKGKGAEEGGVGKYLREGKKRENEGAEGAEDAEEVPADVVPAEYVAKKRKVQAAKGGFGNFNGW
ncbi:hypothetical protein BC936DRAFT_141765 [Jimgerdemannia flammicorona]|uniref:Uncharacterized protein n=1 Tax=Jimgerdemannia flammicorona TaxID=994334 RepID=A0A433A1P1_9FUNG|nr:hypothetical protein BC936DRAFT_141765 [Jimgerdemannia flammicorona]